MLNKPKFSSLRMVLYAQSRPPTTHTLLFSFFLYEGSNPMSLNIAFVLKCPVNSQGSVTSLRPLSHPTRCAYLREDLILFWTQEISLIPKPGSFVSWKIWARSSDISSCHSCTSRTEAEEGLKVQGQPGQPGLVVKPWERKERENRGEGEEMRICLLKNISEKSVHWMSKVNF